MNAAQPYRSQPPALIIVAVALLVAADATIGYFDTYPWVRAMMTGALVPPATDPAGFLAQTAFPVLVALALLIPIVPVLRGVRGGRTWVWVSAVAGTGGAAAFLLGAGTADLGARATTRVPELAVLGAVLVVALLLILPPAARHFRGLHAVFISYRREGDLAVAEQIRDRLSAALGRRQIFLAAYTNQPGAPVPPEVAQALVRCRVMVAVIGRGWVSRAGNLADPADQVRREIETALVRGVEVIPVLVDVELDADRLPPSLSSIAHRTAFGLRSVSLRRDCLPLASHLRSRLRGELPVGIQALHGRDGTARPRA